MGSFCRTYMWCLMVLEQILHKLFAQLPLFPQVWNLPCSRGNEACVLAAGQGSPLVGCHCWDRHVLLLCYSWPHSSKTHQPLAFRLSEEVSCDLELVAEKGFPLASSGFPPPSLEHPFCNYVICRCLRLGPSLKVISRMIFRSSSNWAHLQSAAGGRFSWGFLSKSSRLSDSPHLLVLWAGWTEMSGVLFASWPWSSTDWQAVLINWHCIAVTALCN